MAPLIKLCQLIRVSDSPSAIVRIAINCSLRKGYVFVPSCSFRKYTSTSNDNNLHRLFSTSCKKLSNNVSVGELNNEVIFNAKVSDLKDCVEKQCVRHKDLSDVINYCKADDRNLDGQTRSILLESCSNLSAENGATANVELIKEVWELMNARDCTFTVEIYNSFLKMYIKNGHYDVNTTEFLNNMKVQYDSETLELLLVIASQSQSYQQCKKLVSVAESQSLLSEQMLNRLILTFDMNGDFQNVMSLMNTMDSLKIPKSDTTYSNFTKGLLKLEDPDKVNKIIKILSLKDRLEVVGNLVIQNNLQLAIKSLPVGIPMKNSLLTKLIIKMIRRNKAFDAVIMMKTYTQLTILPTYFLEELVTANYTADAISTILKCVNSLENYYKMLRLVIDCSLTLKHYSQSLGLIEHLQKCNEPLKIDYFKRMLDNERKDSGESGVFKVLQAMKRLGIRVNFSILMNHVLPFIYTEDSTDSYKKLMHNCTTNSNLFSTFLSYLLEQGQFGEAMRFRRRYHNRASFSVVKSLIKAYEDTKDLQNCAIMYQMIMQPNNSEVSSNNENTAAYEKQFLEAMEIYKRNINNLEHGFKHYIKHFNDMHIHELENLTSKRISRTDEKTALKHLLLKYCREDNLQKVLETQGKMNEIGFEWTNGLRSMLFKACADNNLIEEAFIHLDDIRSSDENFIIDSFKIVDFAVVLVENENIDGCIKLLNDFQAKDSASALKNCWKLLDTIARSKYSSYTKEVLDILVKNGYCKMQNTVFGPLIRAELVKEDFTAALELFNAVAEKHRALPLKQELMGIFIKNDDVEKLKSVYKITKSIQGEKIANASIVVALAQWDKVNDLSQFIKDHHIESNIIIRCIDSLPKPSQAKTLVNILESYHEIKKTNLDLFYNHLVTILNRDGRYNDILKLSNSLKDAHTVITEELRCKIEDILKYNNLHDNNSLIVNNGENKPSEM